MWVGGGSHSLRTYRGFLLVWGRVWCKLERRGGGDDGLLRHGGCGGFGHCGGGGGGNEDAQHGARTRESR